MLAAVRAGMPDELCAILDATVAAAWLLDPQICELYGPLGPVLFPDVPQPFVALGREMARMRYRGVYRVFLSIPSTSFVMSRAAASVLGVPLGPSGFT